MKLDIPALIALLVTLTVCLNARFLGERFNVMAMPDKRKRHARPTPQVGGLAILSGLAVWLIGRLFLDGFITEPLLLAEFLAAGGLALVGFIDDQREISPVLRILLVLAFTGIALALDPRLVATRLTWYSFASTPVAAWVYYPLIGVTALGLVNSVNMADGQNGLVGGMFVTWAACLMFVTQGTLAAMAGLLLVLGLLFLAFNLRSKMFLGDCGSYGITFAIGLMAMQAYAQGHVTLETIIVWFFVPVMDCVRLLITRPLQGRSPFSGGRDHFHHRLIDSFGIHFSALIYVGVVAGSSLVATLAPRFSLLALCALCGFYFSFARLSEGLGSQSSQPRPVGEGDVPSANVVPLKDKTRHGHR